MPHAIRSILTIAAAERAILYRTPKFWVLAGLGFLFEFFMLLGTTIATIVDNNPPPEFLMEGTETFLALYFFSYMQAIVIIFVAGDFRKAEQQVYLDQVMLSRPMTTANWVIGKYLGVVGAMMILNLILLGLASVGRLFKVIFMDVGFNLLPSIQYFFIATLPSILFMTALVFFLISLLRVQALAILLPLGYVASIIFYFRYEYQGLLDYGCFFAPLFHSDLIGFGNIEVLLWQRVFFVLLAFTLLCGSILLYPRLSQSAWSPRITQAGVIVFMIGALGIGWHIWTQHQGRLQTRRADLASQAPWVNHPAPKVTHYDFDVTLGDAATPLQAVAKMAVRNPHDRPLDTLVFGLNGALDIRSASWSDSRRIEVRQEHQLLLVELGGRALQPGATDTLTLAYAGAIDADTFMLDRLPEGAGLFHKPWDDGPWVIGDISAWTAADFALLPPQSGWYPTPGAAAGYPFDAPRPVNFATGTIRVHAPQDMRVVSQGARRTETPAGGGMLTTFDAATPVPGFSLNAGPYARLSRQFEQTEVELYYYGPHIVDIEAFSDIADTCYQAVDRMLEMYEEATGVPYPYPRLAFVEAPIQTQVYPSRHGIDNILLQPGVVMLHETKLAGKRFGKEIEGEIEDARRRGRDDTEWRIKRDVFINTVLNILMPDRYHEDGSLYSIIRNYFHFQIDIADPILSRGIELQMHESAERLFHDTFFPDRWNASMSSNERLRQNDSSWALRRRFDTEIDSVMTFLKDTPLMALRPYGDGKVYRASVDFKAPPVVAMLRELAGRDAYRNAIDNIVTDFRRRRMETDAFVHALRETGTADATAFADQWFNEPAFPGYRITLAEADKWDTGKMQIAYQVRVRVQNGEEGDGFVRLIFHTRRDKVRHHMTLNSHEEKEMRVVLTDVPQRVQVMPFFARNRGEITKPISIRSRLRKGTPADTLFAVESSSDSLDFVLDDQDVGFFVPETAEAKYLRPPLQGKSWLLNTHPQAFGRYIFGFHYKNDGGGDYPARWETAIPRTGDYEVSFRLPPDWWARNAPRTLELTVESADGTQALKVRSVETADGWLPIGRFRFTEDLPAAVELADVGGRFIIADAVRWTYVK